MFLIYNKISRPHFNLKTGKINKTICLWCTFEETGRKTCKQQLKVKFKKKCLLLDTEIKFMHFKTIL